jgi:uncharacterized paraquat-inducible protein A
VPAGQLTIDFEYDERSARLATELALVLTPYLAPGTARETVRNLASRVAMLAEKRYRDAWEPQEPIRCHTCDEMTFPKTRVRVAVCPRCSLEGRSVGSGG